MYRETGEEFDAYLGNDPDALDHYAGEIDFDRIADGIGEYEDETESELEVYCECLEDSVGVEKCKSCSHTIDCHLAACNASRHLLALRLGPSQYCVCHAEVNQARCKGCGHKRNCPRVDLLSCKKKKHQRILFESNPSLCSCQGDTSLAMCATCRHRQSCVLSAGCSNQIMHTVTHIPDLISRALDNEYRGDQPQVEGVMNNHEKPFRNSGKRWSKEEDELLIERFQSELRYEDIATLHERTPNAIKLRLIFLAFPQMKEAIASAKSPNAESQGWSTDEVAILSAAFTSGLSIDALAAGLNRQPLDVMHECVVQGLASPKPLIEYREPPPPRGWTKAELLRLREDFRRKLPIDLMASNVGKSPAAILAMLYKMGEIQDSEVNSMLFDASQIAYPED